MNVQGRPIPIVIEVVDVAASSNECNHNKSCAISAARQSRILSSLIIDHESDVPVIY
ncbi:MAG: hypothetical protein WAZ77_04160 [Candidatus Nitrosopolaris sp.]